MTLLHPAPAEAGGAKRPTGSRAWLLLPAAVALLAGLDAGLILLGVPAPVSARRLPDVHGMVMALGFVGTVVCLERAIALGERRALAAPALLGVGSLLLVTPLPLVVGRTALVAGMAAMTSIYVPLWRRQRDDAVLVQAHGAVLGTGAALMWLGGTPMATLLPWLAAFLVLTIAGERLELARLAMGPGAGPTLVLLSGLLTCGVVAALLWPSAGHPLLGLTLLVLTGWLAVHDVAWRTIRSTGLPRYTAAGMLGGYLWLLVAGAVWLVSGSSYGGPAYDAVIHAVFLGFTISMIMAHAPVILPAVLRRPLPYHPLMWAPLALLHVSLLLRLWIGDALGQQQCWQLGGVLNEAALLSFAGLVVWSLARARRTGVR
ncbi:hypothetical protein [Nocardioides terrisoli]|uniref:hypothetical protein n=1 Tax=Nocardioides terrisoli TaxID=3388267 RepID=UPI00287BC894|nr:hypothetical protein [Nocardioides marmorisolisilvae]